MRAWLFCAKIRRRTRNNRLIEFPFASVDACEIVFNSVRVDPPINPSRTTKDVRVEETPSSSSKVKAKLLAEITAVDARSLRSAVVGLIDSVTLVLETVERCERESVTAREEI